MHNNKKGYTLIELVVAMAVMSVAAAMAVTFCIVSSNAVTSSSKRNVELAQLQSAGDFVRGWAACFDSEDYSLYTVEGDRVCYISLIDGQEYALTVARGAINAATVEGETSFDISALKELNFDRLEGTDLYKMTVSSNELSTQFVITKRS